MSNPIYVPFGKFLLEQGFSIVDKDEPDESHILFGSQGRPRRAVITTPAGDEVLADYNSGQYGYGLVQVLGVTASIAWVGASGDHSGVYDEKTLREALRKLGPDVVEEQRNRM